MVMATVYRAMVLRHIITSSICKIATSHKPNKTDNRTHTWCPKPATTYPNNTPTMLTTITTSTTITITIIRCTIMGTITMGIMGIGSIRTGGTIITIVMGRMGSIGGRLYNSIIGLRITMMGLGWRYRL